MDRAETIQFGKKLDNEFKIIERKFKDNNVYFFIEITKKYISECYQTESYIHENSFDTYDDAFKFVEILKKEDKKVTVLEEKVHTL
jgi:hypothetical protein